MPDSQITFNFPFKGAFRLLTVKRNLFISAYDNENSLQTVEDLPEIILQYFK